MIEARLASSVGRLLHRIGLGIPSNIHTGIQLPSNLDISYESLQYLAAGKSAAVYAIDEEKVLKVYHSESHEQVVEQQAFERLGSHPNIARYMGRLDNGSIILGRGQGLREIDLAAIPLRRKLRWIRHAAEGLRHIHEHGIVQADVGCYNMILGRRDCLQIIDFEGCSIDGAPADSCYQWFSYRPSEPDVSEQTDIFAYGCAIYEILTGKPPYHELSDSRHLVRQRFLLNSFPDVAHLPLNDVIRDCWLGSFHSMADVIVALDSCVSSTRTGPRFLVECLAALGKWFSLK